MIIRIYIIHMDLLWVYVYGFTIVTSLYSIVKMEGIEHLWMTLLICCSTIPAHVLCLIFAHKFRFGIVSSNDHGSLPFYVYLFVCLLYHWQEVSQISQYQMRLIRSRNCLPFASTWIHPVFFGGDHVTHLFYVQCCVVLFSSSCVLCSQCCLWVSLECLFLIVPSVFSVFINLRIGFIFSSWYYLVFDYGIPTTVNIYLHSLRFLELYKLWRVHVIEFTNPILYLFIIG